MPFEKGKSGNPNGRQAGVANKATTKFKEALNTLLESAADEMVEWLAEIENPKERFAVIKDLAEYIHPKLARTEALNYNVNENADDITVEDKEILARFKASQEENKESVH